MVTLVNRAKVNTSTTGTGSITLTTAVEGYQTFSTAGVANGDVVRYVIEDGADWEIGTGTYTTTGSTLTRNVSESSNGGAAISLGGDATIFVGLLASDIVQVSDVGVTVQAYDANIVSDATYVHTDNNYTTAEKSKLAGVEAGATADQTAAEILTAVKTVDGAASGLDADLLDGLHASSFLQGNQTITLSGDATGSGTTSIVVTVADDSHNHIISNVDGLQVALDGKLDDSQKGAANGLAELDATGRVPATQLPSYVDDVLEYASLVGFPVTGEAGKLYVALDSNDVHRWTGSAYVKVSDAVSSSDQATKLATPRNIALAGDVSGIAAFDGSANISITATVADDSHNHIIGNVDGLQVALDGKAPTVHTHTAAQITDFDAEVSNNTSVVANTAKVSNATHTGEVTGSTALTIASNVVDADNLKVTGNGTTSQYLRSDGDGSFTWATPTDTVTNQTITLSGDATGSGTTSIVVTVADDSHNHIISNVDGLQAALDAKLVLGSNLFTGTTFTGAYPMAVNVNGTLYSHTTVTFTGSTGALNAPTFNATSVTNGGFQGIDADTALIPSFTWTSDLNTGMWHAGVDQIGFTTAGVNRLTISTTGITSTLTQTAPTFNATSTSGGGFQGIDADTAAAPSFTWSADLNTGIYRPAADQIGFTTGGTLAVTISGSNITAVGNVTAYSDRRLKSDIVTIPDALDKVKRLRGVNFIKDGEASTGVIAQEIQEVIPEVVLEGGEYLSVAYGNLVGLLIESIKELEARVQKLEGGA